MAFESIQAEIGLLLTRLTDQPHDRTEVEIMLREKLNELRAYGMPLPQDLVDLETALDQSLEDDAREPSPTPKPEK